MLGVYAICCICNEFFVEIPKFINTLWNDEIISGLPICRSCFYFVQGESETIYRHLNYKIRRKPKKKQGIERWL